MSFTSPGFMVAHPAASLPLASITPVQSASLTDAAKRSLIDFRTGELGAFSSASSGHGVRFVFTAAQSFNRLVIPAGHNLVPPVELQIVTDDSLTFPSPTIRGVLNVVAGSGVIDFEVTPEGAELAWQLSITGATGTWELGEIWFGNRVLVGDQNVQIDFDSTYVYSRNEVDFPGGASTVQTGPPRKLFSLEMQNVDRASAGGIALDEVMRVGRSAPFWYWPPETLEGGPYLVKLARDPERVQDFPVPMTATRYTYRFEMAEVLL